MVFADDLRKMTESGKLNNIKRQKLLESSFVDHDLIKYTDQIFKLSKEAANDGKNYVDCHINLQTFAVNILVNKLKEHGFKVKKYSTNGVYHQFDLFNNAILPDEHRYHTVLHLTW